jgi:hypothetical protein
MPVETTKSARLSVRSVADKLDVTPSYVRTLARAGALTPIYPGGQGRGKKLYLITAEVDAYMTGGIEGVIAYRKRAKKKK